MTAPTSCEQTVNSRLGSETLELSTSMFDRTPSELLPRARTSPQDSRTSPALEALLTVEIHCTLLVKCIHVHGGDEDSVGGQSENSFDPEALGCPASRDGEVKAGISAEAGHPKASGSSWVIGTVNSRLGSETLELSTSMFDRTPSELLPRARTSPQDSRTSPALEALLTVEIHCTLLVKCIHVHGGDEDSVGGQSENSFDPEALGCPASRDGEVKAGISAENSTDCLYKSPA
ncbi:hypothetical protein C8R47DRAFT_1278192 [Mycena vitilis]|nr:hypothetical protein C8R47DRAFT_1278192 [Mycena vitilis]